jgi:uncharacterized protein
MDYENLLKQIKGKPRVNGYVSPKTETRFSSIQGLGLFATEIIAEGDVVAAWGGKVTTKEEIEALPAEISYNYALQLYPGFYLAERSSSELDAADCINHSCEPDCKLLNRFIMIANRMIDKDEELTADFSNETKEGGNFKCNCGSKNCKDMIYTG